GADIQMALDVCPPLPSPRSVVEAATERTHRWAGGAGTPSTSHPAVPAHQVQFGIVQGGIDEGLRARSARALVDIGFEGYGVGGLSVGETRAEVVAALAGASADSP